MPAPEAAMPVEMCGERTAMMPKRRRTRAQNRAQRIATERRRNRDARQPRRVCVFAARAQAPPADDDDPPPF